MIAKYYIRFKINILKHDRNKFIELYKAISKNLKSDMFNDNTYHTIEENKKVIRVEIFKIESQLEILYSLLGEKYVYICEEDI